MLKKRTESKQKVRHAYLDKVGFRKKGTKSRNFSLSSLFEFDQYQFIGQVGVTRNKEEMHGGVMMNMNELITFSVCMFLRCTIGLKSVTLTQAM